MTRLEYYMKHFPQAKTHSKMEAIYYLCCKNLGLTDKCLVNDSCKDCWNREYKNKKKVKISTHLPKNFTQHIFDKFNKLW